MLVFASSAFRRALLTINQLRYHKQNLFRINYHKPIGLHCLISKISLPLMHCVVNWQETRQLLRLAHAFLKGHSNDLISPNICNINLIAINFNSQISCHIVFIKTKYLLIFNAESKNEYIYFYLIVVLVKIHFSPGLMNEKCGKCVFCVGFYFK